MGHRDTDRPKTGEEAEKFNHFQRQRLGVEADRPDQIAQGSTYAGDGAMTNMLWGQNRCMLSALDGIDALNHAMWTPTFDLIHNKVRELRALVETRKF